MRWVAASIPAVLAGAFALSWWMPETRDFAWRISDENQPVELGTFLALFAGGVLGLDLARKLRGSKGERWARLFYAAFALGLLFVAMEEISWGQWFFGFATPESLRWRNAQGELNLHNLGPLYGTGSALRLFFALGGAIGFRLRRRRWFRGLAPPRALLPWFGVIGACAALEAAFDLGLLPRTGDAGMLFQNAMPEVTELLVGIAAFLYVVHHRRLRLGGGAACPTADLSIGRAGHGRISAAE